MKQDPLIMDAKHLQRALMRIAHEILESNKNTNDLVIIGIRTRGAHIAERIRDNIKKIDDVEIPFGILDITLHRDDLFTTNKQPIIQKTEIDFDIADKNVILVDDVLFSGRTVRAALDELIDFGRPRTIQLAVLIDRGHRELPIKPDYIGKNVPTAMGERISVKIEEIDKVDEVVLEEIKD